MSAPPHAHSPFRGRANAKRLCLQPPKTFSIVPHMDIVVINLDRSPRKLEEFERANRGVISFERFAAIDGVTLAREKLIADGILHADLKYPPGAIGCAVSHINLWKRAVETN